MNGSAAFYTVSDSLGNLRIRVRLEHVQAAGGTSAPSMSAYVRHRSSISGIGDEGSEQSSRPQAGDSDKEIDEYTFKWQEKVFSQREFLLYGSEANCENVLQMQYHQDILRLRGSGGRPTKRLFSYTEHDQPMMENRLENTAITATRPSFLVEKMATVRHRRVAPRQQQGRAIYQDPIVEMPTAEGKRRSHTLAQSKLTYRIMADLGPCDSTSPDPKDEHVLCTIRVFNDRLLSVEPDFNYQTKAPYRIKSRLGDFQYTIQHEQIRLVAGEEEKKPEMPIYDYRTSMVDAQAAGGFDVPEEGVLKVYYMGEILSARGFEYSNLFIHYLIELPRGWYCTGGLWGTTNTCRTAAVDKGEVAYFSCPLELELCCNMSHYEAESAGHFPRWPQIFFEVVSTDSWNRYRTEGYGYHTLPVVPGVSEARVGTWRPLQGGRRSEMRRFFIGGLEELDELDYTRIPKGYEGNKLSKFGFQTRTTGEIGLRFYTAFQCREFISTDLRKRMRYGSILEKIGASVGMHSSIISVLEAFQRARQRMIAVRDNIYAEEGLYPA